MQNITKAINEYLYAETSADVFKTIFNDLFPTDEGDGLISRHDPSTAKETSFIDGTAEGVLNIAYYSRFKNASDARAVLSKLIDTLDDAEIIADDLEISVEAVTLPQFVSVDDKGATIYTASIRARYSRS